LGLILTLSYAFKISIHIDNFGVVDGNFSRGLVLGVGEQGLSLFLNLALWLDWEF